MNSKTRKAVLEYIKHWEQNLDLLILNYLSKNKDLFDNTFDILEDINIYCDACPLCKLFDTDEECSKCPIGHQCTNSPWVNVSEWFEDTVYFMCDDNLKKSYNDGYKVISDEINYLYSLLDEPN